MQSMIDWQYLDTGNHRITCPSCGRAPKDKTLGVTIEPDGSGVAHCFRCEFVESYKPDAATPYQRQGTPIPKKHAPPKRQTLAPQWFSLWSAARPLEGTLGAQYLKLRGCPLPANSEAVRFIPDLRHPDGWSSPALLALVTHAIDGHVMTLHRTWIEPGSPKAKARMLLGGHEKKYGVVRLHPHPTHMLAIAEGIETALSLGVYLEGVPAWSLIDAGNMAAFPVLEGVQSLVIGADHDKPNPKTGKRAGFVAANKCAQRWRQAGRKVKVLTPKAEGMDFNDLVKAQNG